MVLLCSGISIIWSSVDGILLILFWSWSLKGKLFPPSQASFLKSTVALAWIYSLILWIYYAIVEEFLTTIAHICAVILGILIGYILTTLTFSDLPEISTQEREALVPSY